MAFVFKKVELAFDSLREKKRELDGVLSGTVLLRGKDASEWEILNFINFPFYFNFFLKS